MRSRHARPPDPRRPRRHPPRRLPRSYPRRSRPRRWCPRRSRLRCQHGSTNRWSRSSLRAMRR
ncbi:MAG: hypothetical protein E6J90_47885 [Deltaproteobacteria bacterium]|nr:MAG: hypothetical protein E6J90_47885 [Deltaproteobacteria bacterium]TMQ06000.1 MAG: hypothetical protein E6J91_39190 [Deltaproteobacteria bacterium]